MTRVVVLGAGVTGMCAALHLKESALARELDVTILEQEARPGGLLQSSTLDGYQWDNGAYIFLLPRNYLVRRLPGLFQPVQDFRWEVWLRGRFYSYPFRLRELTGMLSLPQLLGAGSEFIWNDLLVRPSRNPPDLRRWLCSRLPSILVHKTNLETYVAKLQGLPLDQLSPILGARRLGEIRELADPSRVVGILRRQIAGARSEGRHCVVLTCGAGVGAISQGLAELCRARGVNILCNTTVNGLERPGPGGLAVQYHGPTGPSTLHADYVISTIPLNRLASIITPRLSPRNRENARRLNFMNLRLVFLVVNRPRIRFGYYTLYSFQPQHCWKRLVARSLPNGQSSILVELAFHPAQPDPGPESIQLVIRDLIDELRLFSRGEVALTHTVLEHYAYPIYQSGFDVWSDEIMSEVRSDRLLTAGRQGNFRYETTHDNAASGITAARRIVRDISKEA